METTLSPKTSNVSIRTYSANDEESLLDILLDAFGSFGDIQRTRATFSSKRFQPTGCFIAEENKQPVGWVAATSLPRDKWFVIRYLSVKKSAQQSAIARCLLSSAIAYVESKNPTFLRATTPAIQPFVSIYQEYGFSPIRRDFRISWQLSEVPLISSPQIKMEPLTTERMDDACRVYVKALSPFWDWRTEEEGGTIAVSATLREDVVRGAKWFLASSGGNQVGLAGIIPDYYEKGVAWFRGAFVLPDYRGRGIGSALMSKMTEFARSLDQRKMVVYTFSYLDSLAPGALLYLRTGGKIEAEYLQLAMAKKRLSQKSNA